jgi:hypothetical protein
MSWLAPRGGIESQEKSTGSAFRNFKSSFSVQPGDACSVGRRQALASDGEISVNRIAPGADLELKRASEGANR